MTISSINEAPQLHDARFDGWAQRVRLLLEQADMAQGEAAKSAVAASVYFDRLILTTPPANDGEALAKIEWCIDPSFGIGAGEAPDDGHEIALRQVRDYLALKAA